MGDVVVDALPPSTAAAQEVLFHVRRALFEPGLSPAATAVYPIGELNPVALLAGFDDLIQASPETLVITSVIDLARMAAANSSVDALVRNGLTLAPPGMVFPAGHTPPGAEELLVCHVAVGRAFALDIAAWDPRNMPPLPPGFDSWALLEQVADPATGALVWAPPQYLVPSADRVAVRYYVRINRNARVSPPLVRASDASLVAACPDHPDQPLSYWCATCEAAVCIHDKMMGSHALGPAAQHPLVPLSTILATTHDQIRAGPRAHPDVAARAAALDANLANLDAARAAVRDQADRAATALRAKYDAALASLESITAFHNDVLRADEVELRRQAQLIASVEAVEQASLAALDPASLVASVTASRAALVHALAAAPLRDAKWNPSLAVRGELTVTSGIPPVPPHNPPANHPPPESPLTHGRPPAGAPIAADLLWRKVVTTPQGAFRPAKPARPASPPRESLPCESDERPASPPARASRASRASRSLSKSRIRRRHSEYGHKSPGAPGVNKSKQRLYRRRGARRLVRLIMQDEFALALALGQVLAGESRPGPSGASPATAAAAVFASLRETAYNLVQLACAEGAGLRLVLAGVRAQLDSGLAASAAARVDADLVASLFNGSSLASHVMVAYAQVVGLGFVQSVLAPVFAALARPLPHSAPHRLRTLADTVIAALLASDAVLPLQFGALIGELYRATAGDGAPDAGVKAVGSFIVLRVFCPAIAKPELYGLGPVQGVEADELLAVSTILQHLVSGIAFAADSPHAALNDFLRATYPALRAWLEELGRANADPGAASRGTEYHTPRIDARELESSMLALAHCLRHHASHLPPQLTSIRLQPGEPQPKPQSGADPNADPLSLDVILTTILAAGTR
ncbi:uncharacterized protein AMSG_05191 [Thecamonas trahens ATCC 50062]|uniref:Ras-GAP domain-containing protein n=1 Tax=Thecamonas trahens ATCC 50062 TaxID=461836 RepID=A0A0L0DD05_THETB|nr:hypothetical protein AMSG_05191 [Thecamonas trahens ATCC 50062]KNC49208.1 hypothetical protein AMSG_05191 [Thecamonas trahens ATCC 50062]|eukprot:XP_013757931.1 hypothetical protein AMSG_05191 [Thecamonas trahens ATCC 50062]